MMLKLRSIIFLLAFALLIQNTCVHGFAGKTSLASACANCSVKHDPITPQDGGKRNISGASPVHFPLYVFEVPKTSHTFRLEPIKSARPVLADSYKDALPDELFRPPQARSL
jgi:hypothetical protein